MCGHRASEHGGVGRMAPFELVGGAVKRLRTESPFPYLFAEEA